MAAITVCLQITAWGFHWRNDACHRQTIRERLPTLAPVYQQQEPLLCHQLERVTFALGGHAGQLPWYAQ